MKEKLKGILRYISSSAVVLAAVLLITASVIGLRLVTQSPERPVSADNGIGVTSLGGGQNAWIDPGVEARLLACAVSRARPVKSNNTYSDLCLLSFTGEDSTTDVVLLRNDDSGRLAFRLSDGSVVACGEQYIRRLLGSIDLDPVLNQLEPPQITVLGTLLQASEYHLSGTDFSGEPFRLDGGSNLVTELGSTSPAISIECDYTTTLSVTDDVGTVVFSGSVSALSEFMPVSGKRYDFTLTAALDNGSCIYRFACTYSFDPIISVSASELYQGDSLVIKIDNLLGRTPSCSISFDYEPRFHVSGDSAWTIIPIDHTSEATEYSLTVSCGDFSRDYALKVLETQFEVQNLTISEETASSTVNSADANREYVENIYPLFEHYDDNIYWDGTFIQPAEGSITTEYGVFRYTNGSTTASRHAGIDIANAEGTPIYAPNSGVVLFSGMLQLSGNTIMLEHGGGLHSLFMHMSSLAIENGQSVEKGQLLGYMGTTGYSTGPHLHYQLMIGSRSISPWRAFDGSAGFYKLKQEA